MLAREELQCHQPGLASDSGWRSEDESTAGNADTGPVGNRSRGHVLKTGLHLPMS